MIPRLWMLTPAFFTATVLGVEPPAPMRVRVECAVVARNPARPRPAPFTIVAIQPSPYLQEAEPVAIDEERLAAAVHAALISRGYAAAARREEAQLAVVVSYGRGEYPPPFELMGIDPRQTSARYWPPLLRLYDQAYFARDYDLWDGHQPGKRPPAEIGRFNLIAVSAFDAEPLLQRQEWRLRWETRVTTAAEVHALGDVDLAMVEALTDSLGLNRRAGVTRTIVTSAPPTPAPP
jgi:hypothetical protein